MKVVMVGTGYVGLVSGTCFADFGHTVVCVDKNEEKINGLKKGILPIYEPGLDTLIEQNVKAGRLSFSTNLAEAMEQADAVFIAVGTPSRKDNGHADLSYVYAAAEEIGRAMQRYTVVVDKSTVPVGTAKEVQKIIKSVHPTADFDVVSNPEFLREGSAIGDFTHPDRIVIGVERNKAAEVMLKLYKPLTDQGYPIIVTTRETSELIKYAANAFLAMKISYINEIADLCEKCHADVKDVSKGIGLDTRIGEKFLNPGPGYGGSCFPKDTLALLKTARDYGCPVTSIETTVEANNNRKIRMGQRIIELCDQDVKGKKLAILGVTFKANTDDMRDAPSLSILPALKEAGAELVVYDPQGLKEAQKYFGSDFATWTEDVYAALRGADAAVILTEWSEIKSMGLQKAKELMKGNKVIDLRNLFEPDEVKQAGLCYFGIGRIL